MIIMYICLHVKYRYYCPILMKLKFYRQIFEKYLKIKLYEKYFEWEPSCSMRTDRRTDLRKLRVAIRSFANKPKNRFILPA
jgi:hypothetical protein